MTEENTEVDIQVVLESLSSKLSKAHIDLAVAEATIVALKGQIRSLSQEPDEPPDEPAK